MDIDGQSTREPALAGQAAGGEEQDEEKMLPTATPVLLESEASRALAGQPDLLGYEAAEKLEEPQVVDSADISDPEVSSAQLESGEGGKEEEPALQESSAGEPATPPASLESGSQGGDVSGVASLVPVQKKQRAARKKSRRRWVSLLLALLVLALALAGGSRVYINYSEQYHGDLALATTGMQQLQKAEALLQGLSRSPLNPGSIEQAGQEFTQAAQTFEQLQSRLRTLPGFLSRAPVYGARLQAALDVLPIVITAAKLGRTGCGIVQLLETKLRNPFSSASPGLTSADLARITSDVQQIRAGFASIVNGVNQLQPSDWQADPRITRGLTTLRKDLPTFQNWLDTLNGLLPVAPLILGIGKPTDYLLEILDSTELRPGGGFIGNYGVLTLSGAQMARAHITDVDLLDKPYEMAGHSFPYPPAYAWFDIGSVSWSFRDSNLDADFPTAARYGEMAFAKENGGFTPQGVIAITPWFIEHLLKITGPIQVPEYGETINAANLVARIHYYQLGPGEKSDLIPAPGGHSSLRKRFTELLSEHLIERVRAIAAQDFAQFVQLGIDALRSKDIQLYFNDKTAEAFLQQVQLDSSILSPPGDNLMVVDANIAGDKANSFILNTMNDQVTIDPAGNAVHHLTLQYAWTLKGNIYGNSTYRDYVRVYAPAGSTLQTQRGWTARGTSQAFNHEVWAGFFKLAFGQTRIITLAWSVPHAATLTAHTWHYQEMIQRQAGALWTASARVTLPACAALKKQSPGLSAAGQNSLKVGHALNGDLTLAVDYTCA